MLIHRIYLTLLISTCIFTFCILLIDLHSSFEFKSRFLLSFFIFLFFTSVILLLGEKLKSELKTNLFLVFCLFLICAVINSIQFGSGWKTQTILYHHLTETNRSIEFQIADQGIFGYSERTVEVKRYFLFIEYIKEISEEELDLSEWEKVDIFVNEAELKGG